MSETADKDSSIDPKADFEMYMYSQGLCEYTAGVAVITLLDEGSGHFDFWDFDPEVLSSIGFLPADSKDQVLGRIETRLADIEEMSKILVGDTAIAQMKYEKSQLEEAKAKFEAVL